MTLSEIAWAAGLFEGEGCITHNGHGGKCPKLIMCTTDKDVMDRFVRVVQIGHLRLRGAKLQAHHQDQWEWRVLGFESVQATIALLWFGLGARRRARAKEILSVLHRQ
jgi:hypothetical protein